jgi:hypothetical protein
MNRNTFLKSLLLMIAALMLTACGRDDAETVSDSATPGTAATEATSLFERIDGDAVYVFANLDTLPDDLVKVFWEPLEGMADFNRKNYGMMADQIEEDSRLAAALLREFAEITSIEAVEARGLNANGHWAVHAISIYPVMHWALKDQQAFAATLERLATESGTELPRRSVDGEEIIWVDMGNFGAAIHYDDAFVTIGVIPDDGALLRRIANIDQPTSAYNPRNLSSFNRERGFTSYGSGYVDFGGLIARLLDADDPLTAAVRQRENLTEVANNPACQAELGALTSLMPRFSMGATRVDRRQVTALGRLETNQELGNKLAGIANTPVNLDTSGAGLISGALAFNLIAARDFGRELVGGWVDNPPECPLFNNIRDNAADWQLALNRPIPPFVTNLQGFRFNMDRLAIDDAFQVQEAQGTLAVFMRNPQMLIGMAQMFSPELAELNLSPGAEPQALPPGTIPNMPNLPAFLALSDGAIGLAVGEGYDARIRGALEPGQSDSAILSYGINIAEYGRFMEQMMGQAMADMDDDEYDMGSFDFMGKLGESYDESIFSINLTPSGIDFISSATLKQ